MSTSRTRRRVRRLDLGSGGMLMTPEEFDAVTEVDDRFAYELIRGIVIVTRYPAPAERDPNEQLGYFLRLYQDQDPQGGLLDATLSEVYILTPDSRRRADRGLWIGLGRVPDLDADLPTIVVEFVSRSRRDRVRDYEEKRAEYLALGIAEYWVIDRFARTMTVYRKPPAEPAEQVVEADGIYRTPLLPGFELPPSRLLVVADRWKRRK